MEDTPKIDPALLLQIQNIVDDLLRTDYPSFERHVKRLARLLRAPGLRKISDELAKDVDLDAWLKAGESTVSGWVGSGRLEWPADPKQELGTVIKLIDKFAELPDWAVHYFAPVFYHVSNDYALNLQNLAEQILVPFARDYVAYVSSITTLVKENAVPQGTHSSTKVFVVHGHDVAARESVARFLEKLDLKPIILHDQPTQGRTIIEKVEAHSDVGFAVVLLTPDDVGGPKDSQMQQPRARQNVLLELGYFIGRLGRSRVCALKRGELELPTDFAGVVWEQLDDASAWKQRLGRELAAAGFEINWNNTMGP